MFNVILKCKKRKNMPDIRNISKLFKRMQNCHNIFNPVILRQFSMYLIHAPSI